MTHVDLFTMGCSKNLVDTERLLARFAERGFLVHHDPEEPHGDIAVVNTCGFIGDAKQESINFILQLAEMKEEGTLKALYAMGCLTERYRSELRTEIPELDGIYGKFDYMALLDDLSSNVLFNHTPTTTTMPSASPSLTSLADPQYAERIKADRYLTTPTHYAYLKISEGCDRRCAYCAIPLITGKHISRPMEDILDEVRQLVAGGVHEFQVIAQELTFYGLDLYGESRIAELIDRMADIPGVRWIRLHYAYPDHFPTNLLDVMRRRDNVCKYLDIALQHISDSVLERMQRHTTKAETLSLIDTIRSQVPGITLRTTLMVGFPGETEEEFEELLDFVRTARFERMGAFAYSEEEGTYAATHYVDDVSPETKQQRLDTLMAEQQNISAAINAEKVGRQVQVVIDRCEGEYFIGRTEADSPEVDGEVLIKHDTPLQVGAFYEVRITDADEFDLYGRVED
ncbi:MAG: 30S ribosomal protein S12 methylthiotransferase RimO [Bacteroidaceae bacterium]|nr:30S ribosomal protein S12 methylthiotransferase RimO [Bacteroidaceae bacterium]